MLEWYTSRADTDEQLRAMLSAAAFSSAPLPPAAAAALPALLHPPTRLEALPAAQDFFRG
jgi:hypothetical protein